MRDKLIELLKSATSRAYWNAGDTPFMSKIADHLIANGVTFAEDKNVPCKWIPVSEKYPEYKQDVLMYFDTGNMAVGFLTDGEYWSAYSDDGWFTDCDCFPLFWMPLPEAPKEVE